MAEPSAKVSGRAESGGELFEQGTSPINKAFQLLDVLADASSDGAGVREIARRLGLPVSSVHRLLVILVATDMVARSDETRRYSIGPEGYRLAARITRAIKISDFALPAMRRLTGEFNETALLGMYLAQQNRMMFTDRYDGTHFLQYRISLLEPLSLMWGASGKSILAFLDQDVINAVWESEGPSPVTGAPPPKRAELLSELEAIRRDGVSISTGEKIPGARGVAAPVFGPSGVVGCLCVTSPVDRLSEETVHELSLRVVEEANQVSDLFGGVTPTRK